MVEQTLVGRRRFEGDDIPDICFYLYIVVIRMPVVLLVGWRAPRAKV